MSNILRNMVSKQKKRFVQDGFNLDLTYVTPKLIAMGLPSKGFEAMYRNPMSEVKRLFEVRHKGHYKVYNLCKEQQGDMSSFPLVEYYPFEDHSPCPLELVISFCQSVDNYLREHKKNVVAIHCKAGKGRTGLMVASYLLHSKYVDQPEEALALYDVKRTYNWKGITIPSQKRYVYYYHRLLQDPCIPLSRIYQIRHIRLVGLLPNDYDIRFEVSIMVSNSEGEWNEQILENTNNQSMNQSGSSSSQTKKDLECSNDVKICGDTKITFFDENRSMFYLWLHTAFINSNFLRYEKSMVDKAFKDKKHKKYGEDFSVEIYVEHISDDDLRESYALKHDGHLSDGKFDLNELSDTESEGCGYNSCTEYEDDI